MGKLIHTRDEPSEGGVICTLQELGGLVTGGAAVFVQGGEQRRKNASFRGTSADGPGVRNMFFQLDVQQNNSREVCGE